MDNQNINNEITFFAETDFRNQRKRFGIKQDDRRRHVYLIGKTGMGKTTLMENMIYQDIKAGRGVALVDPHGDFVEKILDYIPSYRVNDVVYFNPADIDYPIAFNILESLDPKTRHIAASGLIGVFKKLWADSWGPRLEYLLRNAILALMEYPNSTILGVMRVLVDKNFRKKVVAQVKDPIVKAFWTEEYTKYSNSFQVEAINPIQNKVGQFISNPLIRNIIGQVKSSFNVRELMDNNKILLLNLSKGRIGEDASALLGSMMITKIQLAAMERVNIPEEERKDFYLYVDEFQNFATESFADILSEARKYRLNLIITNQYIEQLSEAVRAAIFGNVGTLITFRVGPTDAEILEKEFAPKFTAEDLINLSKYHIYIKLMIDGVASEPFSAVTLPPLLEKEGNAEKIIRISRERYGRPRKVVEEKIMKWSMSKEKEENPSSKGPSPSVAASMGSSDKNLSVKNKESFSPENNKDQEADLEEKIKAVCSYCGGEAIVSFIPDGIRPVFCKKCLELLKQKELVVEKNPKGEYIIVKEPQEKNIKVSEGDKELSLEDLKRKVSSLSSGKPSSSEPLLKKPSPQKITQKKPSSSTSKKPQPLNPGEEIKF